MQTFPSPGPRDALAELQQRHSGARILLAEDNVAIRKVIDLLLQRAGLVADVAADGVEALEKAAIPGCDLILMDMRMPRMDGLAATRVIRALPGRAATPILAVTANAVDEEMAVCLAAGMNGVVGKPVIPALLYQSLLHWLDATREPARGPASGAVQGRVEAAGDAGSLERLRQIPGFDIEAGLAATQGDADKLQQVLALFVRAHGMDLERLAAGSAAVSRVELGDLAHTLKGSAGMVGAWQVAESARCLYLAVGRGADPAEVDARSAELAAELAGLVAALGDVSGGA